MLLEAEFWVAVGFVLFLGVLVYMGVPEMMLDALDRRGARIQGELDDARRLREEAEALLAEYRRKHQAASAEADKAIAATKQAAMTNVRGIAAEVAATIVERLIGTKPSEPTVAAAVDDVLKR